MEFIDQRGPIPEHVCRWMFRSLLQGLKAMHNVKIIHRDVKPGNLLLTADGVMKLCDFGKAIPLGEGADDEDVMLDEAGQGTPRYMAPDAKVGVYTAACDVWSAGVILLEAASGYQVLDNWANPGGKADVQDNWEEDIASHIKMNLGKDVVFSKELMDLLHDIFVKNHKTRITLDEMLNSPWMRMSAFGESTGELKAGEEEAVLDEMQAVADLLTERKPQLVATAVTKVLGSLDIEGGEVAPDFVMKCKGKFDLMRMAKLHMEQGEEGGEVVEFTQLMHVEKQEAVLPKLANEGVLTKAALVGAIAELGEEMSKVEKREAVRPGWSGSEVGGT